MENQSVAYYWAKFNSKGKVTFSNAPKQGELDSTGTYLVKDNKVTFKEDYLLDTTGKVVDGKLVITVDTSDTKEAEVRKFTFEKVK